MLLDSTFGPWLPDMPDYQNPGVTVAYNVSPAPGTQQGAIAYEPVYAAKAYYASASMPSRPLGTAVGKDRLGVAKVYAGNTTQLCKINPSTSNWQNISRSGGYATAESERWENTEYNGNVFFTNYSNEIQWIDKNVDTQFANATTLVKARHIATVKNFVVVGNTFDAADGAMPFRVRWSGLDLPLSWDFSQTTGADFQDIPGYGAIQAIVGGELGWILMEQGVVKMTFDGFPLWFRFDPVAKSKGCAVAESVIRNVDGYTYFLASDGFYRMDEVTGQTTAIGSGIDDTFLATVDTGQYDWMTVAADPRKKLIYWSYVSTDGDIIPGRDSMLWAAIGGPKAFAAAIAVKGANAISRGYQAKLLTIPATREWLSELPKVSIKKDGIAKHIDKLVQIERTNSDPATRAAIAEYLQAAGYEKGNR